MGDMNERFHELNPGEPPTPLNIADLVYSGGVRIASAMVPVPDVGLQACLVFVFAKPEGGIYQPICLVLPDDEMESLLVLVASATDSAVAAARRHRSTAKE